MTSNEMAPADLDQTLRARIDEAMRRPLHDAAPDMLHHYTGPEGLLGIVEKGVVRATHYQHLNDPQEIRSGGNLMFDELKKLSASDQSVVAYYAAELHKAFTKPEATTRDAFVASFTTLGDQLSQWRAYGHDGRGYSIALRIDTAPLLTRPISGPNVAVYFKKCIYSESQFRERIAAIVNEDVEHLCRFIDGATDEAQRTAISLHAFMLTTGTLSSLSISFKAASFQEEHECRLIAIWMPPERPLANEANLPKFRPSHRGVVPYLDVPLGDGGKKLPLAGVCVGPALEPLAAKRSVELLLQQHGYELPVDVSSVSYRGA